MTNTLFLPELREMLSEQNSKDLTEFCTALHPARTAEFMEGLDSSEAWQVLRYAEPTLRAEIFSHISPDRQEKMLADEDESEVAELVTRLPADDAVDLLGELDDKRVEQILALVPAPDRRDPGCGHARGESQRRPGGEQAPAARSRAGLGAGAGPGGRLDRAQTGRTREPRQCAARHLHECVCGGKPLTRVTACVFVRDGSVAVFPAPRSDRV